MQRQKNEPVVLADTSRLTFPERLEYQKLGIMADDLPIIHLNNRMEKAEYESVLGLFLEKVSRKTKEELDEAVRLLTAIPAFAADGDGSGGVGTGSDIWSWLDYALGDFYNKFLSVSTIAACVAASICLILMNFSTDDRAVTSSRAWLKRILLSWVILNVLGYIMTYLVNLTQGGAYTP